MSPAPVSHDQREAFYAAAVAGLRGLDAREGRPQRFGPDADTRWASFRGNLNDADRVDLLLRDASGSWGAAFSPAEVFGTFGLAPDEPFGPDWQPMNVAAARRAFASPTATVSPVELAALLGLRGGPVAVPNLSASTCVAVAGASALIAVAEAFQRTSGLSWSDQVLAVATTPANRQLAALLAIVVGSSARTRLVRPGQDLRATLKAAGFARVDAAVVSADAEPPCTEFARRAAGVP